MRASISGSNGNARLALSLTPDEVSHLLAGLPQGGSHKVQVQGDTALGLRLSVDQHGGLPLVIKSGHGYVDMPADLAQAEHAPISPADVLLLTERDDYGPVLRSAPFPLPFVPEPRRRFAKQQIEAFEKNHPRAAAQALFKGRATVKLKEKQDFAWVVHHEAIGTAIKRWVARLTCECGEQLELPMKVVLHESVIEKKFLAAGWRLKGKKATCPTCQSKPKHSAPPATMAEVIDHVTAKMTAAERAAQLKAATAMVNRLVDEMHDPTIKLVTTKNRIDVVRMVPL